MKIKIRKMFAGLAAILTFMACSFSAYAASNSYSITAAIPVESEPYTAASCDLYLVGRAGGHGDIIWNEIYAKYGVDGSKDGIKNAANNLMPFIRRDGIEPDRTATADGAGIIRFTDLSEGVYLISGNSFDVGNKTYHPIPTLAVLPYWDGTGWVQDVQVEIKSEIEGHGGGGNTPNDSEKPNGSEDPSDPTEPENPENPEDPEDPGPVDPGEPEEPVDPNPESPEPGDDPEQNEPSNPITPGDNDKPAAPDGDADRDRLPQTGQNWIQVIVLLFVGGSTILIGAMSRQADDSNNSEDTQTLHLKYTLSRTLFGVGIVSICAAAFIAGWNFYESNAGEKYSENVGAILQEEITKEEPHQEYVMSQPDGWENSMATYEIDGTAFVGMLSMPSLGLDLPVAADWSEDQLKRTVCRYYGASDDENLVICGHSYKGHFGRLQTLHAGDEVSFTDVDGSQYIYSVREIETLEADEIEKMIQSDFDLTLFTCTFGGGERIAIRCEKV